jgi:DNA-binding MarR family transcriptional regulator
MQESTGTTEEQLNHANKVALQEAATQILSTLPAMFRTIKHQARGAEAGESGRDLGGSQIWVLHALTRGKQLNSELARDFNVANPTMTRIVDGLVERGYVERRHDPYDRRRIYLSITEQGRDVERLAHQHFRDAMAAFLSPLSDKQLAEILVAFRHLQSLLPEDIESGRSCQVKQALQISSDTEKHIEDGEER